MRLLVVSRSPMMAMTLRAENFDVLDLRPPRFSDWLNSIEDEVDALVLDLSDPQMALQAVIELRARARMCPALLVSGEQEGWDDLAVRDLPAARVLPLPVTRPALLTALSDLLAEQEPTPEEEPGSNTVVAATDTPAAQPATPEVQDLEAQPLPRQHDGTQPVDTPMSPPPETASPATTALALPAEPSAVAAVAIPLAAPLVPETVEPPKEQKRAPAARDAGPSRGPEAAPIKRVNEPERAARLADSTAPATPAMPPAGPPPSSLDSAPPAASPLARGTTQADLGPSQLVRLLQERLSDLISVGEVADVVISDAVERVRADAGALLVPDDLSWRVSGGVGLRPLEQRLELDEGSWLVTEVAHAGQGVIVEDSDIARNPLKGAPLASWRHILLAPIPLVDAILVLARSDVPFDESDLTRLVVLSKEAGPLLQTAMETRALARSLRVFTDSEPG